MGRGTVQHLLSAPCSPTATSAHMGLMSPMPPALLSYRSPGAMAALAAMQQGRCAEEWHVQPHCGRMQVVSAQFSPSSLYWASSEMCGLDSIPEFSHICAPAAHSDNQLSFLPGPLLYSPSHVFFTSQINHVQSTPGLRIYFRGVKTVSCCHRVH